MTRVHGVRWVGVLAAAAFAVWLVGCQSAKVQSVSTAPTSGAETGKSGVAWRPVSFDDAMKQAKQENKPVMMDVMADWCHFCKKLDSDVWSRPDVGDLAKSFVPIQVDGDKHREVATKFSVTGYPTTVFLSADGKELGRVLGAVPYEDMLMAMQDALKKAK